MEFTGERLVPNDPEHKDLYYEHIARYLMASKFVSGKDVLDLGCGYGYGSNIIAQGGAKSALGVDNSKQAVNYARENYLHPNTQYLLTDAFDFLRNSKMKFDLLVCFEFIEHISNYEELLDLLSEIINPGGILILSTPNPECPVHEKAHNPFHVSKFPLSKLKEVLESRFKAVKIVAQRRAQGVGFFPLETEYGEISLSPIESRHNPEPEYFIALCGLESDFDSTIFEVPFFDDMDRLKRHLGKQDERIATQITRITKLQNEVMEKGEWGNNLDKKVNKLEIRKQDTDIEIANLRREIIDARTTLGFRLHAACKPFAGFVIAFLSTAFHIGKNLFKMLFALPGLSVFAISKIPGIVKAIILLPAAIFVYFSILFSAKKEKPKVVNNCQAPPLKGDGPLKSASIIIPSFNGKTLLEKCLPSLETALEKENVVFEIIVVDGGSSDGTCEYLKEKHPKIKILAIEKNLGFSGNANAGAKIAKNDVLYFLNNDMVVTNGFLKPVLERFSATDLFAVSSNINRYSNNQPVETGLTRAIIRRGNIEIHHVKRDNKFPRETFFAQGGASGFLRSQFILMGGFDKLYSPFYGEDLDISWRAKKAGYRIEWVPNSKVIHMHRGTIGKLMSKDKVDRKLSANILTAAWRNLNDPKMIFDTTIGLLKGIIDGRLSFGSFYTALKRLPVLLERRIADTPPVISDSKIFQLQNKRVDLLERYNSSKKDILNILALSPYCLYPPTHGGAVRMFELLRRVAKNHRVHLLSLVETPEELNAKKELEAHFDKVTMLLRGPGETGKLTDPNSVLEFRQSNLSDQLEVILEDEMFDIVQVEYPNLAHLLPYDIGAKTVITQIDILFRTQMRKGDSKINIINKLKDYHEAFRLFQYEKENGKRADLVLAMSQKEKRYFESMTGAKTHICPNGIDSKNIPYSKPAKNHNILFVGNFRHSPNIDAVDFFVKYIYPHIRKKDLSVRLTIAGPNPPEKIKRLAIDPSIKVPGFVPDILDLYRKSRCVIAPVTRGSGTRIKILEAMAAGPPVVSTTVGIEGIKAKSGTDLLVNDDPKEFAKSVLELIISDELAEKLSKNARRLVETKYDWDLIAKKLIDSYKEILGVGR